MHPGAYFMHVLFNSDKFAFIRKVSIILAVSRKAKADGGVLPYSTLEGMIVAGQRIVCS